MLLGLSPSREEVGRPDALPGLVEEDEVEDDEDDEEDSGDEDESVCSLTTY